MRQYKIQQTSIGYSVAVSVDGGQPFIEGDFKEPSCFKYLVASWAKQQDTSVIIQGIGKLQRPEELADIVKHTKGLG